MAKKTVKEGKGKTTKKCENSNCCKITLIVSSIAVIAISIITYQQYVKYSTIPDMPKLDLDKWWGSNEITKQDTSIRPFRILFPDSMLEQLSKKFEIYRNVVFRKKSLNETWDYGINYQALAQVIAHWNFKYTYRERVRYLNQFNHFKTNIQGLDIHFLHVKPAVEKNVHVVPLLLLHGWPGSFREFYDAIPLLTTKQSGYNFVFEVIVPSLPGFIYSQAPTKPGLGTVQIAIIMRNLMQRLGFTQYYVQGGDFGHTIGTHMATIFPNEVIGLHTNFPVNFSKLSFLTWIVGAICPSYMANGLADRMYPLKDRVEYYLEELGYMHLQGTKPDTLGIVLNDSPVGLAAYLIDKFMMFTDPNNKELEDGGLSKYYSYNALLDHIMLYWSTGSITTALRLYKEAFKNHEEEQTLAQIPTRVPTWGLRFKHELIHQPDFVLRWKYPNLVGTTTLDIGGHFGAFERPKEFAEDVFLATKNFMEFYDNE